jgi:pyruvate/2-oxoglutarate dehydrogenase complex dihydrolipoamide acyltransferase (E2) component
MCFFLDENLSPRIARIVRDRGVDASSSHEVGRNGRTDAEQLAYAASEGRCVVTADCRDFERLTAEFLEAGRPHAGVVCIPPTWRTDDYVRIARAIVDYAERRDDAPSEYLCAYLT